MGAGIKAQDRVCYVLLTDWWARRHEQEVRSGTILWHARFLHLLRGTNILDHYYSK